LQLARNPQLWFDFVAAMLFDELKRRDICMCVAVARQNVIKVRKRRSAVE
jgi:hypothetical protein